MSKTIYFKNKYHTNTMFSSEIFDTRGRISMAEPPKSNSKPDDKIKFKEYRNINEILNDDSFIICTDDSFTENELHLIQNVIFTHGGHVYGDETVMNVFHKIEKMLARGIYLPDDKSKIIRK